MKKPSTIKGLATSIALFAWTAFALPFVAAIWTDHLRGDVVATILAWTAISLRRNRSIRAAAIAQFLSGGYALYFAAFAVVTVLSLMGVLHQSEGHSIPMTAQAVAVPVLLALAVWGLQNAIWLNPLLREAKIPDHEATASPDGYEPNA